MKYLIILVQVESPLLTPCKSPTGYCSNLQRIPCKTLERVHRLHYKIINNFIKAVHQALPLSPGTANTPTIWRVPSNHPTSCRIPSLVDQAAAAGNHRPHLCPMLCVRVWQGVCMSVGACVCVRVCNCQTNQTELSQRLEHVFNMVC